MSKEANQADAAPAEGTTGSTSGEVDALVDDIERERREAVKAARGRPDGKKRAGRGQ